MAGVGMAIGGADAAIGGGAAAIFTGGASLTVTAVGAGVAVAGGVVTVNSIRHLSEGNHYGEKKNTSSPNPEGSKGKPDHQAKVGELEKKAQLEAGSNDVVIRERKIQGHDSNRRPDVQTVGPDGKTRKVYEAERKPTSQRNIKRQEEYKKLGVDQETHKVGN